MSHIPYFDPEDVISHEIIEQPEAVNERSTARRVVLQVLYELDSTSHPIGSVIDSQLLYHTLPQRMWTYIQEMVVGILAQHERLDRVIQHFAPEWPLSQVAIIDRNILRIAIYEFTIVKRTPVKVAIDEAVRLAKLFGAEGSSRFVNGVLGAIVDDPETLKIMLE